ncbi:hypothetical protein FRB95_008181 [Tulasnella sp. JGI-2019a]|nr:hypothetical protein FRB95_008181 [Tulasnella sp. JGI-2019a]
MGSRSGSGHSRPSRPKQLVVNIKYDALISLIASYTEGWMTRQHSHKNTRRFESSKAHGYPTFSGFLFIALSSIYSSTNTAIARSHNGDVFYHFMGFSLPLI